MHLYRPDQIRIPEFAGRLVKTRRELHRHPELGFQEVKTAKLIATRLKELGIPFKTGIAKTGVLATLKGDKAGPTVLYRADMDALPLPEANDVPYRSEVPDRMHACGHDAHVAIALGVAEVLATHRKAIPGTVKICFQPAEEGPGGAQPMIEAGVLQDPKVDYALGLHVWNELPKGTVGVLDGPAMAAADEFTLRVTSKGGHGALPHQTHDPIVAAAALIQAWQAIASRELDPLEPFVLSVCQVQGGYAPNIIPAEVKLRGTVRTFDAQVREEVRAAMVRIAEHTAKAYGCGANLDWEPLYPATVNHAGAARLMRGVVGDLEPRLRLAKVRPCMGAEDMSYFLREVPGCFVWLGSSPHGDQPGPPHHSNRFDIDEDCLPLGVELMLAGIERFLVEGIGGRE